MQNKELENRIKLHIDDIIKTLLNINSSNVDENVLRDQVYSTIVSITDEILTSDTILKTQNIGVGIKEGVSMQFTEIVQWWQNLHIKTSTDLAQALDNFKIVFACNSNSIEGNPMSYHTTREVFEGNSLSGFSGTARDIFEAQNQKFAFNYFIKAFEDELEIDIPMILKFHNILMYGCYDDIRWKKGERPGKFKIHDYCVGVNEIGSFPEDVQMDMQDLIDDLNDNSLNGDVLIKAAYLHVMFETIHPFADGNGRVGRTLLNYYLIRNNYPPVVIFNEDKETYYLALEVFNRTGKLQGFVKFLQEQMVKTWENKIKERRLTGPNEIKRLSAFL